MEVPCINKFILSYVSRLTVNPIETLVENITLLCLPRFYNLLEQAVPGLLLVDLLDGS